MIPFRTMSDRLIDLDAPTPADISIADIACGLSRCCRFAGQVRQFYSVAQHAVLVMSLVHPSIKFAALHHDDSEAYMGDLARHLKHADALHGYRGLEAQLMDVIRTRFTIPALDGHAARELKCADNVAAVFEHLILREHRPAVFPVDVERLIRDGFIPVEPAHADDFYAMMRRLPPYIHALDPDASEFLYLRAHQCLTLRAV